MDLITTTERTGRHLRAAGAPPLRHHRHRIPARDHLLSAALRGAAGEHRRGRRDRRARARHRSQAVLRTDGERAACSRCSTPRARTSKSSGTAPTSSRIRSSTPRSPPWCWATAIRSPTTSSCSASPATCSTSRTASPTGPAGRCRTAQVTYAVSDVTHLRDVYHGAGRRSRPARPHRLDGRRDGGADLARHLPRRARARLDAAEDPGAQAQGARRADRGRGLARARGADPRRAALARAQGRHHRRHRGAGADHAGAAGVAALAAQGLRALEMGRRHPRRGQARARARSQDAAA